VIALAAGGRGATWAALGAGAVAVGVGVALLPLPPEGLIHAGLAYALCASLVLRGLGGAALAPADHVTLARAAAVCLLVGAVGAFPAAPVAYGLIGGAATALDGVDGWIARRTTGPTAFGARFDMETDAALGLVLSALLVPVVGIWVLAVGLARYAFLAAGWIWPALAAELPPSGRRRAACTTQLVALAVTFAFTWLPSAAIFCALVAFVATAGSFAIDLAWLLRRR
jgi:phosphatidylglycerophosphate synthase